MGDTNIQWTDKTWNPVVGCQKVSEGCRNCYAKTLHDMRHRAHREGKQVPAQYAKPFEEIQLMPNRLGDPLSWKKPQRVFVNSVSDLFHKDVPNRFLDMVFAAMALAKQHIFQVLTKRADRMQEYVSNVRGAQRFRDINSAAREVTGSDYVSVLPTQAHGMVDGVWPLPNVHLGVSVENQAAADSRIPHLLATPAAVRFLSCEPLLSEVDLSRLWLVDKSGWWNGLDGRLTCKMHMDNGQEAWVETEQPLRPHVDWVIVGCESGSKRRAMQEAWASSLVEQCNTAGVKCFVKQMEVNGRVSGEIEEFPQQLRVRRYPEASDRVREYPA